MSVNVYHNTNMATYIYTKSGQYNYYLCTVN